MPQEPRGGNALAQTLEPPKFRIIDAAMILLALVSVTLVLTDILWREKLYDWGLFTTVIFVDLGITLVFVADFVVEARGKPVGRVIRESWFDIIGLIPMIAFIAFEA